MQSNCDSYVFALICPEVRAMILFFLVALSEAGQYPKDLPQFGPQIPNKLPRSVLFKN
jgi:hypothetical protein